MCVKIGMTFEELPPDAPSFARAIPIGELASACLRKLALNHLILMQDRVPPGVNFLDDAIEALDIADKLQGSEPRSPGAAP
jgi:hypothetical protein